MTCRPFVAPGRALGTFDRELARLDGAQRQ
jgi:hypothetical protein